MTETNEFHNHGEQPEVNVTPYDRDVYSLKKHMGENFIPKFIENYKLEELVEKIKKITQTSKDSGRTPIVSFCSEKGGSGKTTTALSFMQAVVNMGFSVLVIDVDPALGSAGVINSRRSNINLHLEAAEANGFDVEAVLDFKRSTEALVEAMVVSPANFNAALVLELAEKKEYDLIVLDTAGIKADEVANFDLKLISSSNKPHITAGYVSNLIVVPTGTSNLDLTKMINFAQPLVSFLGSLSYLKRNLVENKCRILANRVEKTGNGLKELAEAKEAVPLHWFNTAIRRSEKIQANTSTKHPHTVFTTNQVKQVAISYLELVDEIYSDIEESLEK